MFLDFQTYLLKTILKSEYLWTKVFSCSWKDTFIKIATTNFIKIQKLLNYSEKYSPLKFVKSELFYNNKHT
jgi:hypothetical protein